MVTLKMLYSTLFIITFFLSKGSCCSWCWVPLCKSTPCWDLVWKSHLSHWNNMGSSSSAWTGRSSKHRGKAATKTEIEIFLWIQSDQSIYGLAVRLWVDVRTLYVFVIPLSFNGTRSILCLIFFPFGMKTLIYQTQAAGVVGRGSGQKKWDVSQICSSYFTFSHRDM